MTAIFTCGVIIATLFGNSLASGLDIISTPCCRAVSVLRPGPPGKNISGVIELHQEGSNRLVTITGQVHGLPPNSTHGFHIHESGDFRNIENPCLSTGPHYNPLSSVHGAPEKTARHVGDLGNIQADENGVATVNVTDSVVSLIGPYSVIGRAIVVHENIDDLGVNDGESKKTGNAGSRIACGIIGTVYEKPLEVRYIYGLYKLNSVLH
ncbi:unnamed protein product [Allacma fusca]|uniref:Superoxide dismutase [Cu-Zn] n=1 Tax=Allacma fusca TaxID=39272 RepID=A0A8J2NYK9_9HEXA|nr:unnamed protein product [Allacma fusca]